MFSCWWMTDSSVDMCQHFFLYSLHYLERTHSIVLSNHMQTEIFKSVLKSHRNSLLAASQFVPPTWSPSTMQSFLFCTQLLPHFYLHLRWYKWSGDSLLLYFLYYCLYQQFIASRNYRLYYFITKLGWICSPRCSYNHYDWPQFYVPDPLRSPAAPLKYSNLHLSDFVTSPGLTFHNARLLAGRISSWARRLFGTLPPPIGWSSVRNSTVLRRCCVVVLFFLLWVKKLPLYGVPKAKAIFGKTSV